MDLPQPMERLLDSGPPPFLTKTYEFVEDSSTNEIVSWSKANNSFVVWDPQAFSITLLPKYFKHNNFSSFVRQLNTYGFRKVDPDRWEFANEGFLRGQKQLLKNIRRRKTIHQSSSSSSSSSQQALDTNCVEIGMFGSVEDEINRLRRDKQTLMTELVKLKQDHLNTKSSIQVMEQRIRRTESKQQQMMGFLARAMQNPSFVHHLMQRKDKRKEMQEAINKKPRMRPIDQQGASYNNIQIAEDDFLEENTRSTDEFNLDEIGETFVKVESQEYDDIVGFEVPEFDQLAIGMQGMNETQTNLDEDEVIVIPEEEDEDYGRINKQVNEGFWEDLFSDNIEEGQLGLLLGSEGNDQDEDVDVLVEQLGYLGSNSK